VNTGCEKTGSGAEAAVTGCQYEKLVV
jgi:hypothetical protein